MPSMFPVAADSSARGLGEQREIHRKVKTRHLPTMQHIEVAWQEEPRSYRPGAPAAFIPLRTRWHHGALASRSAWLLRLAPAPHSPLRCDTGRLQHALTPAQSCQRPAGSSSRASPRALWPCKLIRQVSKALPKQRCRKGFGAGFNLNFFREKKGPPACGGGVTFA